MTGANKRDDTLKLDPHIRISKKKTDKTAEREREREREGGQEERKEGIISSATKQRYGYRFSQHLWFSRINHEQKMQVYIIPIISKHRGLP